MRSPTLLLAAALVLGSGCATSPRAGAASSATAMGDWPSWYDLTPLVEVARSHATKPVVAALRTAQEELRQNRFKSADTGLSQLAAGDSRHWVAVARADLAALHFSVCVRGIAWRLEDAKPEGSATERRADFSEDTRVEPGDVSVEAMLTNLDDALASQVPALVVQARIARARVTAFASRCPPNEKVRERAEQILESDLATLAAEGHLTPDLAFMWGGIQMSRYSSAAARPFLLQAQEGGFDDPAVVYMLAIAAMDQNQLDAADELAREAATKFAAVNNTDQQAESMFLRGEIARTKKDLKIARRHYENALKLLPQHVAALLGLTAMELKANGDAAAASYLRGQLGRMLGTGALDEDAARKAARGGEALVILADDPQIAQVVRDALLDSIEAEPDPLRRGLRYFYAATVEARLAEYEMAQGHAILAREEMQTSEIAPPVDVEAFLGHLDGGS